MVRRSAGNAGKASVRCPACGFESQRPRLAPGDILIAMSCHQCGHNIVLRWDRWKGASA